MSKLEPRPDDSPAVLVLCRMHAILAPYAADATAEAILLVNWDALLSRAARDLGYTYDPAKYETQSAAEREAEVVLSQEVGTAITGEDVHETASEALETIRAAVRRARKKGNKK